MGQEAVSQFYNGLLSSGLSIKPDPSALLQAIEFEEDDNAGNTSTIKLELLHYNPFKNESAIRECLNWYAWHASEWNDMYLGITKAQLQRHRGDLESDKASKKDKRSIPVQASPVVQLLASIEHTGHGKKKNQ